MNDEELYRSLFDNMLNGVAYCKMIFEQDRPADFVYLSVNTAFFELTGFQNVVGKRVTELIPGIRESDPKIFEIYARVASTRVPERHEIYIEALQQWFSISVYSPAKDHFVSIFDVITSRKKTEQALRESEKSVRRKLESIIYPAGEIAGLELADMIDADAIQGLMQDFYKLTNIPVGIVDLKGNVLVGVGWQEICANYHRVHPDTCRNCVESDSELTLGIPPGEYRIYKCKNGMWDAATPLTMDGRHMGNLFWGQFFFEDEKIDVGFFRANARKYGFNEEEYLSALEKVPRLSRKALDAGMTFYREFAEMLSKLSYNNIRLARLLTERRRAEGALAASEKKFRDLLENIQLVARMLDCEGNITFCNDYLLSLTGWSKDEVLGKSWFDIFIAEEEKTAVREFFDTAISKGALPSHYENRIIARNGNPRSIIWNTTTLYSPEGAVLGTASIGVDVTDSRKLEEQLRQAEKLKAVGELAGGVAHDFNNILSAIVGYADLTLMKLHENDPLKENLAEILRASDRAVTLTKSLLAFSRKQVLSPKPVDLNNIIRSQNKFLSRLIREDIEISTNCCGHELVIFADSVQIEQILLNLVTNARDAMPKGGRIIIRSEKISLDEQFVATHGYGAAGTYALLSVSDTGEGMDCATKERIFEPFFTTKEQGKGTGLGLAMVYGIVKQHSGSIAVYSEPERGTVIKIYFPLIEMPAEAEPENSSPMLIKGGEETILIAEDDNALRELFSSVLRQNGYRVIDAANGLDAVIKFAERKDDISLVILDCIMPKKNGKEAYQEILAIKPATRTIFLSGYAEDVISTEGLLDPGINFIQKPVSPAVLLRRMREVLDET